MPEDDGHLAEQFVVGARLDVRVAHQIGQQLFGEMRTDGNVVEAGIGGDADERPFELTDVGGDA